ncbi:hypothetical protein [Phaeobacter italicus]|uniref:hypothetical protein n=1 Tax=Phaeobacter italicus TaxID=481446 RepID=UPI001CD627F1|nr:hypothetical protein [Phaeobacter italicus]MCA0856123.1 hypothetical protein [Phaeobacter italicus]
MTDLIKAADALADALAKEKRAHERTIDQRDAMEEAFLSAYELVMREPMEWSSLYSTPEALRDMEECLTAYRQARESADGVASLRDQLAMSAPEAPHWYHHKDQHHYTGGLTGYEETLAHRQWSMDRMTSWRYSYADAMLAARIKAALDPQ